LDKKHEDLVKEALEKAKLEEEMEQQASEFANEDADELEATAQALKATLEGDVEDSLEEEDLAATDGVASEEEAEAVMAEEGDETVAEEVAEEHPSKKGHFGKKKKDKKDEMIEDLTDKLKRSMAEFENYRKRTEKEKASMYQVGAREVVEKLLPVVDNIERGLAAVTEDHKQDPFVLGMEMIYKDLMTTLEGLGVTPIEAVGANFDPNLHNAVMHEENEEVGENTVVEEFQKGYMHKDTVVRHSMVKVAN